MTFKKWARKHAKIKRCVAKVCPPIGMPLIFRSKLISIGRQQDVQAELDAAAAAQQAQQQQNDNDDDSDSGSDDEGEKETLDAFVDNALDNRTFMRVAAFSNITKLLKRQYDPEPLEHVMSSLTVALTRALKKDEPADIPTVLAAFQLAVTTLGADAERLFAEFDPFLKSLLLNHKAGVARNSILDSLALLTFVGAPEDSHSLTLMDLLVAEFASADTSVVATALRCWGFLASIVAPDVVVGRLFERLLPRFVELLESPVADVHVAAANNIGLMVDMWKDAMALEGRHDIGIDECAVVDFEAVRERVDELSHSVAKQAKASERNKRDWRIMLRRVAAALNTDGDDDNGNGDSDAPADEVYDVLEVKSQKVEVEGFSMLIQAEFFRNVLGTGFAEHMSANPLLQEVFGAEELRSSSTDALKKRRDIGKATKERQQDRFKGRDRKSEKNHAVFANTDD